MNLYEESEENGISERIEKYIESDESIIENLYFCYKFAENIIMKLIIDDDFKEKHQRSYLFHLEFVYARVSCDKHKTLKFELFKIMQKFYMILEKNLNIINNIHDYVVKIMGKENKSKNVFQNDDASDNIISIKIVKLTKKIKDEKTKKFIFYLMENNIWLKLKIIIKFI